MNKKKFQHGYYQNVSHSSILTRYALVVCPDLRDQINNISMSNVKIQINLHLFSSKFQSFN